jgi:putative PEP-CTERM system histidine kinase
VDILLATHLLCAAVYLGLALLLALHSGRRPAGVLLIAACVATGLWALCVALQRAFGARLGPATGFLEIFRLLAWVGFLAVAHRVGLREGAAPQNLRWPIVAAGALGLSLLGRELAPSAPSGALFVAGLWARLALVATGLLLAEALASQARAEGLWRVRYLCLGVGGILAYDLFLWSEALLFHRVSPTLDASRGAVSAIAAPLIAVAAARNPAWATELNVARRAVFHGAVLIAVGAYLLALAAAGTALRASGGDWGGVLQAAFVFGGFLLLATLAFSPTARSRFRLELGRYLFTHRHDYREQWQRFAEALSSPAGGASLAARVVRALADVVGGTRGGLWIREPDGFACRVDRGLPPGASGAFARERFARELDRNGDRILELVEGRQARATQSVDWLPEWLRDWRDAWLLVPLVQRGRAIGFVVLARPPGRRTLHREDEELLRTAARHAASYLAAEQTGRQLEEARRFEELSRGLAFIAHDLRNLANDLKLALANARRHIQNPEFQRDLLLSMEGSVAVMQRLLDKLAERRPSPRASFATDFAELVRSSLRGRADATPAVCLDLEGGAPILVACDSDRLVSISGHLVQNAIEAAGPEGHVTVRLRRDGAASVFEVEDDGPGMTPDFVRERLHHPFRSSKRGGLGLGLFECRELARQVGGDLAIDSAPGKGTVARLRLPLVGGAAAAPARPDVGG